MVVAESHDEERKKRETMVEKKLRGKTDFLSTLAFDFSFLKPWNPPLFIGGEKGMFCLY